MKFPKPRYIPPHLTTGAEEQGYVEDVFRAYPLAAVYRVVNYGAGARGAGGTKGVPDDLIFLPKDRILLAWDSKAGSEYEVPDSAKRLTPEQATFGGLMQSGYQTAFGWGDRDSARAWLGALALGVQMTQVIKPG